MIFVLRFILVDPFFVASLSAGQKYLCSCLWSDGSEANKRWSTCIGFNSYGAQLPGIWIMPMSLSCCEIANCVTPSDSAYFLEVYTGLHYVMSAILFLRKLSVLHHYAHIQRQNHRCWSDKTTYNTLYFQKCPHRSYFWSIWRASAAELCISKQRIKISRKWREFGSYTDSFSWEKIYDVNKNHPMYV